MPNNNNNQHSTTPDPYAHLDPATARLLRQDDEEIRQLEEKLGLQQSDSSNKNSSKKRLHREYATLECYGDDFGEFLDELDQIIIPHKSSSPSNNNSNNNNNNNIDDNNTNPEDPIILYRPTQGQDIYGNSTNNHNNNHNNTQTYQPPHLRNPSHNNENTRILRQTLNRAFNRLSPNNLRSVANEIQALYHNNNNNHSTRAVHEQLWLLLQQTCAPSHAMVPHLIPSFMATVAILSQPSSSNHNHNYILAEYILEHAVLQLVSLLHDNNNHNSTTTPQNYTPHNLTLILAYLYNFRVIHSILIHDLIRTWITMFPKEEDPIQQQQQQQQHTLHIELLLLLLQHAGHTLRQQDPTALKDIVLLVQQQQHNQNNDNNNHPRVQYMIQAMNDLKNNRKDTHNVISQPIMQQLKQHLHTSNNNNNNNYTTTFQPKKISLQDILQVSTNGRWWMVGASWQNNHNQSPKSQNPLKNDNDNDDSKLMKLARSNKNLNSDLKRSIFCVLMTALDCDEALEKLVRAGMLAHRQERETVRVLLECCAQEDSFNMYYVHLAKRLCEYQSQCRFSFQLAFWDLYKQLNSSTMALRKVGNLAKLLCQLVLQDCLKMNVVLKPLDEYLENLLLMNNGDGDGENQSLLLFVVMFFSGILESFEDPAACAALFAPQRSRNAASHSRRRVKDEGNHHPDDNDSSKNDDDPSEEVWATQVHLFLSNVMRKSPKNVKGSKFRLNWKAARKACDPDNFF